MSAGSPFGGDFTLDTSSMSSIAETCKELAERMRTMKQELDNAKTEALQNWAGEGRNMFEKKYHYLIQQLGDITDDLFEMSEGIYDAEDSYIQTDMDAAKRLDGVSSPG